MVGEECWKGKQNTSIKEILGIEFISIGKVVGGTEGGEERREERREEREERD